MRRFVEDVDEEPEDVVGEDWFGGLPYDDLYDAYGTVIRFAEQDDA